jgi:nucleotide-binding universal stress UspA family protein/uncharacterized membrane protein YfcA
MKKPIQSILWVVFLSLAVFQVEAAELFDSQWFLEPAQSLEEGGFVDLDWQHVLFLLIVGFIGGLVSGFIGSSGAFILTPAMMSIGVPAITAVASNMCHRFPNALMSAVRRAKSGQVDIKLGLVVGSSAIVGVIGGALVQTQIKAAVGEAASSLYVSFVFIVVLAIVGGTAVRDAWKKWHYQEQNIEIGQIAGWIQSIQIPGTMMYFPSLGAKVSVLFTIPIGLATGLLAATIAFGGFIGVPAMMYLLGASGLMVSATQLVVAFVIGFSGTIVYALYSLLDIRLAMILLAGSLFGIQLGAIATSYVKDYIIKLVTSVIMILVLFSMMLKVPVYLSQLGYLVSLSQQTSYFLNSSSFLLLVLALISGTLILIYSFIHGLLAHTKAQRAWEEMEAVTDSAQSLLVANESYPTSVSQLSPLGRFEKIMAVSDRSKENSGAIREALRLAQRTDGHLFLLSVIITNSEHESMAKQLLKKEENDALAYLESIKKDAIEVGLDCNISLRYGTEIYQEIIDEAELNQVDVIVMGRRNLTKLMRFLTGSHTTKVIGYAQCSVLIVPSSAAIEGSQILLAIDGSRYSDKAATAAIRIAKHLNAPVLVISIVHSDETERRHTKAVEQIKRIEAFMHKKGISVEGKVLSGNPAEVILEFAQAKGADLIVMGSHGRTGLDKVLMGSVSDRVISGADCAVLVVKA